MISETHEGKKVLYQAAAPEHLETFVERQKVMLQEQSARLKDILPQIKSIQREQGERPIIKSFQGRDGAISAYTEFFSFSNAVEKDGYNILNDDLLTEVFTEEEKTKFRELRKDKKVKPVVVYNKALVFNESRDKFLLVKEEDGRWELPEGGLDWGSAPHEDLPREISEEMGVNVTWIAERPSYFLTYENSKREFWVANVLYETKLESLNFTPSSECTEVRFVNTEELKKLFLFPNLKIFGEMFDPKNH